jgi:aminomethyltransferase
MVWLRPLAERHGGVRVDVLSSRIAMIAVQGPGAVETVDRLTGGAASRIRRFWLGEAVVAGIPCRLARTGYTGEDGFEVLPPAERAAELWEKLAEEGVALCGLGARDVLRLEAGLPLHGNDMTVENNPFEAGLERFLYLDGEGYIAGPALKRIKEQGTARLLVGFRMVEPGIPRHGMSVLGEPPLPTGGGRSPGTNGGEVTADGVHIGFVTSGTYSPTLDAAIGMGYVDRRFSAPGARFKVDVRGKLVEAEVVPLPFYSRKK